MTAVASIPAWSGRRSFDHPEPFGSSVSSMFRPVVFEAAPRKRFTSDIEAHRVDDLLLAHVDASPHEIWHPAAGDGEADDAVKVFVPLSGGAVLSQEGREAVLRPGLLGLVATDRDYRISADLGFDFLILMLSHRELGLQRDEVPQLAASPLGAAGGLEGVVVPYLANLAGNLGVFSGTSGGRVARTTRELLSTLLQAQLAPRLSEAQASRAGLFEQARAHIRRNLDDRSLSPGTIAAALHVSPRHLQQIFSEHGETVAGHVRAERLDAARLDLVDPARAHLTIADIAAGYGFTDGAHFTRAFKEAFGVTPSACRARA